VFFIFRVIIDYTQLSDSLKQEDDVEKAVKELSSNIEDTMFKIRTKRPNMKVTIYYSILCFCLPGNDVRSHTDQL
jgi:hypothetical protein